MNNLRLYDIKLLQAWGSVGPPNDVSLAKSYNRKQFEANKENKDLDLPDICKGYRIIQSNTPPKKSS
ncbi:hypothetical protein TSAR_001714 [Trichomalopsis sarcophagae]|uniref:Uncharacterized protein n=1 Tax=Trichomalopsis sarcophagae TaxID=543379 RepID=A0A232F7F1_9HYME|nr:hypothetical protein TSAR_001714 [Trichomalopsis sarcophagae]